MSDWIKRILVIPFIIVILPASFIINFILNLELHEAAWWWENKIPDRWKF